ncbi:hypothetical protein DPMN_008808 [Dreissena polymorpha]|uniref:Uncharacterized protein n=1 Tax=Dreissena polymorpha TaxID=45954 RepID=A0A9D4MVY4_DREPO|nr:hypothetical protein DPMN_008808 [Dreissena polymorpha]
MREFQTPNPQKSGCYPSSMPAKYIPISQTKVCNKTIEHFVFRKVKKHTKHYGVITDSMTSEKGVPDNPFKPSELSHPSKLDQFISQIRDE